MCMYNVQFKKQAVIREKWPFIYKNKKINMLAVDFFLKKIKYWYMNDYLQAYLSLKSRAEITDLFYLYVVQSNITT